MLVLIAKGRSVKVPDEADGHVVRQADDPQQADECRGQADEHPGQSKADELEEEEKAVAASGLSTKMHEKPDQPPTNYFIN